jgi:hypothetical protein
LIEVCGSSTAERWDPYVTWDGRMWAVGHSAYVAACLDARSDLTQKKINDINQLLELTPTDRDLFEFFGTHRKDATNHKETVKKNMKKCITLGWDENGDVKQTADGTSPTSIKLLPQLVQKNLAGFKKAALDVFQHAVGLGAGLGGPVRWGTVEDKPFMQKLILEVCAHMTRACMHIRLLRSTNQTYTLTQNHTIAGGVAWRWP